MYATFYSKLMGAKISGCFRQTDIEKFGIGVFSLQQTDLKQFMQMINETVEEKQDAEQNKYLIAVNESLQLVGLTVTPEIKIKQILDEQFIAAKGFIYVLNEIPELLENETVLNQFDAVTKKQSHLGIPALIFQCNENEEQRAEILNLVGIVPNKQMKVFQFNKETGQGIKEGLQWLGSVLFE